MTKEMRSIAELLFERRARALPPRALAEVFDLLIWRMDDNGAEIVQTMRSWLQGDDPERVAVALFLDEVYPYESREELRQACERIGLRWPQFRDRCDQLMARWDENYGKSNK